MDLFAEQARRTPDATALRDGDRELSYRRLAEWSDRLAARLLADGLAAEDRVALPMDRCAELVVAQLAVLKAGGVYVPVDARAPEDRRRALLALAGAVRSLGADQIAAADADPAQPPAEGLPPADPDQLAYVMFTSGSTGEPKAVAVRHRDVASLATDSRFAGGACARVLLHSPVAFDASTFEVWAPLLTGGCVVVAPDGPVDAALLRRLAGGGALTAIWLTAGLFRLLAQDAPDCFAGLRQLWTGGDVVPAAAVRRVLTACPGLRIVERVRPDRDHHLRDLVPARRTPRRCPTRCRSATPWTTSTCTSWTPRCARSRRAVPASCTSPARAWPRLPGPARPDRGALPGRPRGPARSADVPHRRPGPAAARRDRGVPGPWPTTRSRSAASGSSPARSRPCSPTPRASPTSPSSPARTGPASSAWWPTSSARPAEDLAGLRDFAAEALPDYLVPSAFVAARGASAEPQRQGGPRGAARPRRPTAVPGAPSGSRRVPRPNAVPREVFGEVLGIAPPGADDDFFALGGDSILSIRLVSRLSEAFDTVLTPRAVFTHPDAGRSRRLLTEEQRRAGGADDGRSAIVPVSAAGPAPMSYAQQRLWFLEEFAPGGTEYVTALALRLRGPVEPDALVSALSALVARHESLRTTFDGVDGRGVQLVHPPLPGESGAARPVRAARGDREPRCAGCWPRTGPGRSTCAGDRCCGPAWSGWPTATTC